LLVKALAAEVASKLRRVTILTGGSPGVQETFAQALGDFPSLVHIVREGEKSNFSCGKDVAAGADLDEWMDLFGHVGDIYVCIEGGRGTAYEASSAHKHGALVLPVLWTGGASAGQFDFPSEVLEKPEIISEAQWALLQEKAPPEATASAIIEIILRRFADGIA